MDNFGKVHSKTEVHKLRSISSKKKYKTFGTLLNMLG